MNYAIIVVPVALVALYIYWIVDVRHWFTGPISTVDEESIPEAEPV